jgi:hypothetical protein
MRPPPGREDARIDLLKSLTVRMPPSQKRYELWRVISLMAMNVKKKGQQEEFGPRRWIAGFSFRGLDSRSSAYSTLAVRCGVIRLRGSHLKK